MMKLGSRFRRLQWKLTWSYTWVAALSFLIIETILLVLIMIALGFNPLQGYLPLFTDAVAPIFVDDIQPITRAHLHNQPVDTANLQADLEQILGNEPLTTSSSPFEVEQFASVFVLDARQNLLASTPQYAALPPDGRFFDPTLLTGDDSLFPLVTAAYTGDTSIEQPYSHLTSEALYLVFVNPLQDEGGRLLGVEVAILRTPTPSNALMLALSVVVGGLTIFSVAAAIVGTLFGWRTARRFSKRLTHLSQVSADWGQGNFEGQIQDDEADEIGELGENLNQVAAELQTLLKDKEQIAVLEERDRMARELHDTLAQGVSGLVLQLEAVGHHLQEGDIPESQTIVSDAKEQARAALHKARAVIDDLRTGTDLAPDFEKGIRRRVQEFNRTYGMACDLDVQLPASLRLPPAISLHARRALTEMLSNVARHAQATNVEVGIRLEENSLLIEVVDDGVGFEADEVGGRGHYGILGLKERAQITGGQFSFESAPQRGTAVRLRLPLEAAYE